METNKSKGGRPRDPFAYSYVAEGKGKDGEPIWICKFCGHQFSIKTSSTRIKAHLGKVEKQDVIVCARVPFDVEEAARNSMPRSSSMRSNANITSNNDVRQPLSQECCTSNPPPPQTMQSAKEQCSNRQDGSLRQSNVDVQLNPLLQDDTRQSTLQRCRASGSPPLQNLPLDGSMQQTNVDSTSLNMQMDISPKEMQNLSEDDIQQFISTLLSDVQLNDTPQPYERCAKPDVLGHESPKEMQNFSEDDIQWLLTIFSDPQDNNMNEMTLNTLQPNERCRPHGVLASQHPMQHQGEFSNSLPYQDAPRMNSTHDPTIPHNFLQEDERISPSDHNPYPSLVPQIHHRHIDPLLEFSDTPTSTPDQAMHGKKRKFLDQRPFGKILPPGTIFQGLTFNRTVDEISISLEDDSMSRVGIYGMGGSGKTSIMKHVHNLLLEGYFMSCSHVIWVTVSQDHTISRLQHHLAGKLKVKLPCNEDEVAWASLLYEEMQKMRYVLILDDVWDKVNLEQVGISEPTRDNGCKLILTTRSLDVCRRMQCKAIFLNLLSEYEAWELFVKTLNFNPDESTLQGIMKEVAKECARLPLAIVTVAGSMRGINHVHEWRYALESLRNRTYGFTDMKDHVMEKLKFSYYRLNEQLQKCLLSCALYPEDKGISKWELMQMWIMEGTFERTENRKSAYDNGETILNKLENAYLLTYDSYEQGFMIHDLIRDMCLDIMGGRFLVKCRSKFPPGESEYAEALEKISLMDSEFWEICLGVAPNCPKLTTLLLSENQYLTRISDSFFMGFPELKVLNLSWTSIEVLPSSITNLVSLNALVLLGCYQLRCLPCLTPLKKLKLLNLCESAIEEVPEGIENLVDLTYVNLCATNIKLDSSLIVTNLVKLQCLYLPDEVKIVMKRVRELKNLDAVEAKFANWEDFCEYATFMLNSERGPSDYIIKAEFTRAGASCGSMSYKIYKDDEQEEGRIVATLKLIDGNTRGENWLSHDVIRQIPLPEFVQNLRVYGSRYELQTEESGESKGLFDASFPLAFSNLVELEVAYVNIVKDLISVSCLEVESSSSAPKVLPCFQNLQVLVIMSCEDLENIVSSANPKEKEESDSLINFPCLRKLCLMYLPNWRSILICPSIEYIWVRRCPKLNRLPVQLPMLDYDGDSDSGQLTPPLSSLKEIEGKLEWWESLEWDQPHAKALLQPYFTGY